MSFLVAFIRRQFIYYPPVPTASFAGKTIIVTGASSGLGLEACRRMVSLGAAQVIMACRNAEKAQGAVKDIQTSTSCPDDVLMVWELDMGSSASVLAFADRVKSELPRVDALIANAGVGTRTFKKVGGNEETITTNVVSTALLAFLLHPKLRETAAKYEKNTHITITGSELYEVAKFKESEAGEGNIFATLNDESKAQMTDRYNVSKLLDLFIMKEIAAMAPVESSGVIVNVVAPGFCLSGLHREMTNPAIRLLVKMLARPTEVGSRTLVYGASAGPETHGQYLPDCVITPTGGLCEGDKGAELQRRVWVELKAKLEAIRAGVTSIE